MMIKIFARILATVSLTTLLAFPALAQEQWTWPEKPKNLQVFPKEWSGTRLRPVMIGFEELAEQYRTKGLNAALDDYTDLKKKFYGRAAYDFGEGSLNTFGYQLLEGKDSAGAVQIFKLNTELFPESANVWDSLAEAYMKAGDPKNAQMNYEKALTVDPANQNAKEMLRKLKESAKN
jgi:tetratricopeptide (TPR) repeat protein